MGVRERVRRRVAGVPVAGGNGEWRLVGGVCLFLELRKGLIPQEVASGRHQWLCVHRAR